MTYHRLVARLLLALCFVAGTAVAVAQPITAPLDGIEYFTEHGTRNLKVTNPQERCLRIEKREDFQILQGDDNTRRDINLAESNLNPHQVANIDIPAPGNLLYHVRGVYCDKKTGANAGEAKKPEDWTATYDRGKARIVLEINGPGEIDNKVRLNESDSQLIIRLAGDAQKREYEVTLTPVGKDDSPGMVGLTSPVKVPGPSGVRAIPLEGLDPGKFEITARADGAEPGHVDGEVIAYTVEILVNNTPTKDDDYVQIKSKFPPKRFQTPCQARLVGTLPGEDQSIVIVNPDKRVRFPEAETVPLTLPKDGSLRSFVISGESESQAVEDVELIAKQGSTQGARVGSETATVFWFDKANTTVTPTKKPYVIDWLNEQTYGPQIFPTVGITGTAEIRPHGVNCDAPQISPLQIALMQDVLDWKSTIVWTKPNRPDFLHFSWDPAAPADADVARVPDSITRTVGFKPELKPPLMDALEGAEPLLARHVGWLSNVVGCADPTDVLSGLVIGEDSPSLYNVTFLHVANIEREADGAKLGVATYEVDNATLKASFRAYTVIFNTVSQDFTALSQQEWGLDLDNNAGKKTVDNPKPSGPATVAPVGVLPRAHDSFHRTESPTPGTQFTNFPRE